MPSVKQAVAAWLAEKRPARVGSAEWTDLCESIRRSGARPPSDDYLLDLLLATEIEIDRQLGGFAVDLRARVRTRDPEEAAASLIALAGEYGVARRAGNRERCEDCRRAVRRAKSRLRFRLHRNLSEAKRNEKRELLAWFLIWLENPEIFPDWLELRRLEKGSLSH